MRDFNPLSTGLADGIQKSTNKIIEALKICQPFNDYEAAVNQDMLIDAKLGAEAILDFLRVHQDIHNQYLADKAKKENAMKMYCFRCNGEVTVSAHGYIGCETCGTDQDQKDD